MPHAVALSAARSASESGERHVALVIGKEPSLHSAFLAVEPFRAANRVSGATLFGIDFLAADPSAPPSSMDIAIPATATFGDERKYDLVILLVSYHLSGRAKSKLFRWLSRQAASGAHLCGADNGPLLLAEGGFLDGYEATAHWSAIPSLREFCPNCHVLEQLYVIDRNRSTCAGQVATLDYAMEMLKRLSGKALHQLVCNELIYTEPRLATGRQRAFVSEQSWQANPVLLQVQRIMHETIEEPLDMGALAIRVGVSVREIQYLFRRYLHSTPKKLYMTLRLQRAKELLLYSSLSIRETGLASGFGSPSAYYRAFHAAYQKSPQEYRTDFLTGNASRYGRSLY
ncbi:MAG: helix-turn-helix domain-containing protein [Methylobacterium mesophilicum]|nr:helix-turn-helix domain-containing protein [Methylobacterium mesophilicum]